MKTAADERGVVVQAQPSEIRAAKVAVDETSVRAAGHIQESFLTTQVGMAEITVDERRVVKPSID